MLETKALATKLAKLRFSLSDIEIGACIDSKLNFGHFGFQNFGSGRVYERFQGQICVFEIKVLETLRWLSNGVLLNSMRL